MEFDASSPLPSFNYHGFLPEGTHNSTLPEVGTRLAFNPARVKLWNCFLEFIDWAEKTGNFSYVYIDGGFVTNKAGPEDIDVILQTRARYGPEAFAAMEPFFAFGIEEIYNKYAVHVHFWCEGFPGGMSDFRRFFQYLRPQEAAPMGLKEGAKKGIVRIKL